MAQLTVDVSMTARHQISTSDRTHARTRKHARKTTNAGQTPNVKARTGRRHTDTTGPASPHTRHGALTHRLGNLARRANHRNGQHHELKHQTTQPHTPNAPTLKNHETSHTDCWPLSGPAARYGPMHHVRPHSTVLAWSLLAKSNPPNALRHTSLCAPQIYPTWAHTQPHRDERARAREPGSTLD